MESAHYGDFLTTKFDNVVNWARKFSLFQYPFVTACCGMEYMSASCSHYDVSRFGAEIPRFSPRQSDVLWVVGTVTHKMTPIPVDYVVKFCGQEITVVGRFHRFLELSGGSFPFQCALFPVVD